VAVHGIGTLSIRQTGSESLTIEADDDVLPLLGSEVQGGRLVLGPKPNTTIQARTPIRYTLTVKTLRALDVSGAAAVEATDLRLPALQVTLSGSGEATLAGTVDRQEIQLTGSGVYHGDGLESAAATVRVSGSGEAVVRVRDTLDAQVSGSGTVEYLGDPTVTQRVSGAGSIRHR
jgi:hypothetical protein